jgi:hypothetical protein
MDGDWHEQAIATETGDKPVSRPVVKRLGRADLFHLSATHDRDARRARECL